MLNINKLDPEINVDKASISLCLFNKSVAAYQCYFVGTSVTGEMLDSSLQPNTILTMLQV